MFKHWVWCLTLFGVVPGGLGAADPGAHDWPQWRGPNRDGIATETGLLAQWPSKGPRLVWKSAGLGRGYSSIAVAAGQIFAMGDRKDPRNPRSQPEEYLVALNESNGKELWAAKVGGQWNDGGPRCTPTVSGNLVYALGPHGDLVCAETSTGKIRWRKNLPKDFGGRMMTGWGYSESPLVDDDKLICTPGGEDATLVALNKTTGATLWKARVPQRDKASYSSAVAAEVDRQRQYVQFLGGGVVGIGAKDGKFLWRYDKPANGTANCSTPIYHDHHVFAASDYGTGGGLTKVPPDSTGKAEQVYFTKSMKNHHGGMVLVDGFLYGANGGNGDTPALVCLEFQTGKVMWEERKAGKGSIAFADGALYYRNEGGPMLLVEANPKSYVERGRFDQPDRQGGPAWAHPVVANGKLYLRDSNILLCYDLKQR